MIEKHDDEKECERNYKLIFNVVAKHQSMCVEIIIQSFSLSLSHTQTVINLLLSNLFTPLYRNIMLFLFALLIFHLPTLIIIIINTNWKLQLFCSSSRYHLRRTVTQTLNIISLILLDHDHKLRLLITH